MLGRLRLKLYLEEWVRITFQGGKRLVAWVLEEKEEHKTPRKVSW